VKAALKTGQSSDPQKKDKAESHGPPTTKNTGMREPVKEKHLWERSPIAKEKKLKQKKKKHPAYPNGGTGSKRGGLRSGRLKLGPGLLKAN